MALRTETPEIIRLVEQLSRLTSESAETTVGVALRERLARLQLTAAEAERRARVYTLGTAPQARFRESPHLAVDHGDVLYGDDDLPR